MVADACMMASQAGVDFSMYDSDNDGKVDNVFVFFAGEDEAEGADENSIWSHSWYLFSGAGISLELNGKMIDRYACSSEMPRIHDTSTGKLLETRLSGIGTFCHEFSHALGLPDFYYTGTDTRLAEELLTMDFWSIMDYGQYAYDGYAPVAYTAYERSFLGWLEITELTEDMKGEVKLHGIDSETDTPKAYMIKNPANEAEYYLLENRQKTTWHPPFLGTGMLVLHVNYTASAWKNNGPNNSENRPGMSYVPADNLKQSSRTMTGWNDYKGPP